MHKQSFSDAALIYQQNPNATKVTTLETWNKLVKLVNKGAHSIAVFGDDNKAKHLFDITQTNGKRVPELWKLTEGIADELTAVINKKYGKDCKNIQETIAAMSIDNTRTHLTEMMYGTQLLKLSDEKLKAYQQSFVLAVRFMVSNRCELDSDMKISGNINLNAMDFFKDRRDLIRFCDLVQKSAKDTLLEMEREIVHILKQRRERSNDLQTERDKTDVGRGTAHGQPRRAEASPKTDRKVGKDVVGVGTHGVSDRGTNSRDGGSAADNSEGDRHRSGEPLSGAGRLVQKGKSAPDDVRGNTDVGENAHVDRGTSGDERGSVQTANVIVTVDSFVERYNNADFNRQMDAYEKAGWLLSEAIKAEHSLDDPDNFIKLYSERFSVVELEEIRQLIKMAVENQKSRDFINVSVPDEKQPADEPPVEKEPVENKPVIINNHFVETSDLPPLTDEKIIAGILKNDRFFKAKREQIAEFFAANEDSNKRAEFMKSIINADYTEFDVGSTRVGYGNIRLR